MGSNLLCEYCWDTLLILHYLLFLKTEMHCNYTSFRLIKTSRKYLSILSVLITLQIYLLDLQLFYTVFSAVYGFLLGARDRLGEASALEWKKYLFQALIGASDLLSIRLCIHCDSCIFFLFYICICKFKLLGKLIQKFLLLGVFLVHHVTLAEGNGIELV